MNLNLPALTEQLSARFSVLHTYLHNKGRFLSRVLLYQDAPMTEEGAVYLVPGSSLPEEPRLADTCALVSLGLPPKAYCSGRFNCIVLEEGTGLAPAVNELQRTFSRYLNWCDRLHRTLYLDKGIQAIINEALPMFENPIYVHDKNYRIIAYAENRSLPSMERRYGFLNYGRLSAKSIHALTRIPGFADTFRSDEPAYWEKTGGRVDEFSYLYSNLRLDGAYCGRIFVDERVRPIRAADYVVMAELTAVVELALRRRNFFADSHVRHFGALMTKLLNRETVGEEAVAQELDDLGWDKDGLFFCFQLGLSEADALFNTTLSICDLLESKLHDCQAFPYRGNILAVVNGSRWSDRRHVFLKDVRPILEDFRLHAGVSLMCRDLRELRQYYEQTSIALRFGAQRSPELWFYYFEHYALDYLLCHSTEHFSAEMLCPRPLLTLLDYDKKNGTEFAETLRAYLECDSSPARAMSRLFIHRSTFLYRLGRIQELVDVDLTDLNVKLHFLLAFQLLDRAKGEPAVQAAEKSER